MIFVTIGSLFPFDRLIRLMDGLAKDFPDQTFFAQIADGTYEPANIPYARMLTRREFAEKVAEARLIVAHAGMGSVITAMELNKPIVLLPRILEQGEHTTDHQMATARWLADKPGVYVAMTDDALAPAIRQALETPVGQSAMPATAPPAFLEKIRNFILAA